MSNDIINKQFTTPEQCSNGGKNRASKLSAERRKEIATKASHSRKSYDGIPKATHYGTLNIGDHEIACAVLEDGRSIITESSLFRLLGMKKGGRTKLQNGDQIPRFLSSKNLQTYIPNTLRGGAESFDVLLPKGGIAYAWEASKIPEILKVYLEARRDGILTIPQMAIAATAEIINIALAKTGLISLIHECTGYQKQREASTLQQLFSAFIAKELQPYVKRFPSEFFSNLKRIYGFDSMKKNPQFFGCLINKWVYKELSSEIHEELKRINPVTEAGHRKHRHHQLLTQDIGCPALEKQITKVITLMSVSDTKEDFEKLLERSKK
jgi:P63C domain